MNRSKYSTLFLVATAALAGGCQGDPALAANACPSMSAMGVPLHVQIRQPEDKQPHTDTPSLESTLPARRCAPPAPRIDRMIPRELMTS